MKKRITHHAKAKRYKKRKWKQRHKVGRKKSYQMGYFENPMERDTIYEKLKSKFSKTKEASEQLPTKYKSPKDIEKQLDYLEKSKHLEGYETALKDLGLLDKNILRARFGKPERRR